MALSVSTDLTDSSGRELLEYGTPDFPAAFFYDDVRIVSVAWHWHDELELNYVLEGSEQVTIGRDSFVLRAGEGYFCNSGILHKADALSEICLQKCIVFHPRLIGEESSLYYHKYAIPLLENAALTYVRLTPEIPWQQEALSRIHDAWNAGRDEPEGFEMTIRYLLGQVMLSVVSNKDSLSAPARGSMQIRSENRVKKMIAYIESNYASQVTIGDIASSADISVSECLRCFRSVLKVTPVKFLNQYRIDKAASLLHDSELSIGEIAERCGFDDASYFTRSFKKARGCSPSLFRSNRKPEDPDGG